MCLVKSEKMMSPMVVRELDPLLLSGWREENARELVRPVRPNVVAAPPKFRRGEIAKVIFWISGAIHAKSRDPRTRRTCEVLHVLDFFLQLLYINVHPAKRTPGSLRAPSTLMLLLPTKEYLAHKKHPAP